MNRNEILKSICMYMYNIFDIRLIWDQVDSRWKKSNTVECCTSFDEIKESFSYVPLFFDEKPKQSKP